MKLKFILMIALVMLMKYVGISQTCIDIQNSSVSASELLLNGNQKHTLDLELLHDGNTAVDYQVICQNGSIIGPSNGTVASGTTPTDATVEVELDPNQIEARLSFIITSGQSNSCPNNVYINPVPQIIACLELNSANEVDCYIDNDGIDIDGEVHVYDMEFYNNSTGTLNFEVSSNVLSVYNNGNSLNSQEVGVFRYIIYVDPNNRTGDISYTINGNNLINGCDIPIQLTFPACEQSVCLQIGSGQLDGCTGPDANGEYYFTYNLDLENQSNISLQYKLISSTGNFMVGGDSRTIAPNTSETISFDYKPFSQTQTEWSFYVEIETANVLNGCEELITLSVPSCQPTLGNLQVTSFFDVNENGVQDLGEGGLSGKTCSITPQAGGATITGITNNLGQVLFSNLNPSLYIVNQQYDIPWRVMPSIGSVNNVLVTANATTEINFANSHPNAQGKIVDIKNLSGVCTSPVTTGFKSYLYSGLLSTSFFDQSMLSVIDLNGGNISNIAIGSVEGLATNVPFSFELNASVDPCFLFGLSTPLTMARDTICMKLPECCSPGKDTTIIKTYTQNSSYALGAFLPVNQNNIRLAEITIENIEPCVNEISFTTFSTDPLQMMFNGIYILDGDTTKLSSAPSPYTFNIPSNSKQLKFYLDAIQAFGDIYIKSKGCEVDLLDTLKIGPNYSSLTEASIVQVTPSFSNVYAATLSLKNSGNRKPKYVVVGQKLQSSTTKLLGATGGNYFYFGRDENNVNVTNMKSDKNHIYLELDEFNTSIDNVFNIFFTGNTKAIDLVYNVYAIDGTRIGNGGFTLDGDKVITKIEDVSLSEDEFMIYPNPAKSDLNIFLKNTDENSYTITDMSGKIIKSGTCINGQKINVSQLQNATYHITITSKYGEHVGSNAFLKVE